MLLNINIIEKDGELSKKMNEALNRDRIFQIRITVRNKSGRLVL